MKLKSIVLIGMLILLIISLTGCTDESSDEMNEQKNNSNNIDDTNGDEQKETYESESSKLFGTWRSSTEYNNSTTIISYTFYPDFTFSTYYLFEQVNRTGTGTWFIYDSSLSMTLTSVNETVVYDIEFSNNDTVLRLIDDDGIVVLLEKTSS